MYANTRSIATPGKFDELVCIIQSFQNIIHIVILSETWISTHDEAKRLYLPGYTHYYNYRQDKIGGGVSIFAHNSLKHNFIEEQTVDENHYLWIHINKFDLDIGAIYKPGRTKSKEFLEVYSTQLEQRQRAILFGDFNYDLLSSDKAVQNYKDTISENGYYIINKIDRRYCTRETKTTKTILDHVCSNIKKTQFHLSIVESSMSDHKQIYFEVKNYQATPVKAIKYEAIDYKKLYNTFEMMKIEDCEYNTLEQNLKFSINTCKTSKTKKLNPPKQDWIKKEILDAINTRNKHYQEYKQNPEDKEIEEVYKTKRKDVFNMIQKSKSNFYYKAFKNCKNKPSKMWTLINDLTRNKVKETAVPVKLQKGLEIVTDETEICEYFNDYFSTIGEVLANEIPKRCHPNMSPIARTHSQELSQLSPATTEEVLKVCNQLDSNTSSGVDGISTKTIKCLKNLLVEDLSNCINRCLELGIFPDSLKVAKVSPIFKSGIRTDPGNYRPISVLPVLSKIFERILYNRVEKYLNSIDFFYSKQYGFRPKSNTLSATVDLITNLKTNIDKKNIALGIFIDLRKAFDTVSHVILLEKINKIGITGTALDILKSYLSNRKQIVKIGNHQSQPKPITYGIPQGSILGPLLFLIYINNIGEIGLKGDITLYADDTSLFYFERSIEKIIANAQTDLNLLNEWFQNNVLTINVSKTNYIIFKAKNKKISDHDPLILNNMTINQIDSERYLGLIVDSKLTWKPHIEKIKAKLSSLTGAIRGITRCLPRGVRYSIYNSLIKSHIDYLIEIWGSAAKSHINIIQRAQNKLIKVLFCYNYLTPTERLYKETKIMSVTQTYIYFTCLLIRKILTKNIHTQISFTKKSQIQKIQLRNTNDLVLRTPRTNYGKKNILFEGAKIYNKLPKDIKNIQSINTYKKLLKHYVTLNTPV